MLNRRIFLSQLCAGSATVVLSACGSSTSGPTAGSKVTAAGGGTSPSPAPAPLAPVVPTLRGVTIDAAEQSILAAMATERSWFAAARTAQSEVTVRNADELQAAIDAAFDTAANAQTLALNHRIVLSWNGDSMMAAGAAGRIVIGRKALTSTHAEAGGSVTLVAAAGASPALPNTVFISGQGITLDGIGFTRRAGLGEAGDNMNAVIVQQTTTYPVESMVRFKNCKFGALNFDSSVLPGQWVNGIATLGTIIRYIAFEGCSFRGLQNGAKIIARGVEFELCDFRQVLQDGIDLFGHTLATGYYAYAAIRKTTFREWGDTLETRDTHSDAIQTGTSADRHAGYRVVVSDTVAHMARKYGGTNGKGGGPQGFYNDDHLNADNQFVLRRNTFLVSSPHGFAYYSPKATQPSFVDECTFMRAGTIPSAFAPDIAMQDTTVVLSGEEPANGPWLKVTNTIAKSGMTTQSHEVALVEADPRLFDRAPADQHPEKIFAGRDFGRGGAPVNFVPGKFGYRLPNEAGSQAQFVADVWANFQPQAGLAGKGAPDPRNIAWAK